jgi:predicted nucleic acid-binding protein
MNRFLDASFLIALLFATDQSERANEILAQGHGDLLLSPLVRFEFENAVWLEVFRHDAGDRECFSQHEAQVGLAAFELQLESGAYNIASPNFSRTLAEARRITFQQTVRHGIRSMDVLHLAAAKLLGCTEFLTFDKLQRRVAELEGFAVPL